jgi:serine/threonine protein kinase
MRRCPQCGTEYPDTIAFCGEDGTITIAVLPAGTTPDGRLGARYGEYVVVAPVADGAMGRVYEGRHVDSKKKVAIKILHEDVAKDRVSVERFKREYETARDIESKYIVRVIDFGDTTDKSFFLTMEYLEGEELGNLLRGSGAQAVGRSLRILCQTALGLDDAHQNGVIHRDLKPDNLFLLKGEGGDQVRILDFGSVKLQMETGPKLTAFGTTLGSPYYMSPEQAMGKQDVDNRTDGFALAAITYEILCGKIAFDGKTVAEILMKIVNSTPPPLTQVVPGKVPHALDDVLEKGFAKDKKTRFGSTLELAAAVLGAFGLSATPDRASIESWGQRSEADLEAAIAAAKVAVPAPVGAPLGAQLPIAGAAPASPMQTSPVQTAPAPVPGAVPYAPPASAVSSMGPGDALPQSNTWIIIAALGVGFFLLCAAAVVGWLVFG